MTTGSRQSGVLETQLVPMEPLPALWLYQVMFELSTDELDQCWVGYLVGYGYGVLATTFCQSGAGRHGLKIDYFARRSFQFFEHIYFFMFGIFKLLIMARRH